MQGTNKIENLCLRVNFEADSMKLFAEAVAAKVMENILPLISTPEEDDVLMNVDEVAALLGKSKGQVYQWVNNASHGLGNFPYLKAGKSLRFSKKAILEWMKRN